MTGTTLDLTGLLADQKDGLAVQIAQQHAEWNGYRTAWLDEKKELRNYIFATDTRKTSNSKLPWKNSTTTPKLAQLRDNLHANYMEALFPNDDWLEWEGEDEDSNIATKAQVIENYMKTKLRQDNAEVKFGRLLLDFIDDGNVYGTAEWADDSITLEDGSVKRGYIGPRIVRISANDITFNPLAPTFEESPKIIRTIKFFGELKEEVMNLPDSDPLKGAYLNALDKSSGIRYTVGSMDPSDTLKDDGFLIDGFSNAQNYYSSGYVEILTFYGDIYDIDSDTFYKNYKITIIDRAFVAKKEQIKSWVPGSGIFHAGWRERPDNLYAMGPLDNLVGMQYRIDHLENLKADAFDMIAFPVIKIRGYVEDFDYGPNARIYVGDDGEVEFMHPDATFLSADTQIETLEMRMEELAGAPREAMGIRSPGEKTKFEVQKLDNAASRIFQNKITHFERVFLTKLLNYMLALSRENMSGNDLTRTLDSDIDAVIFQTVSKDDIVANGILRPKGASHFAEKANLLQNLVTLSNSAIAQDPSVNVHLSGKRLAKLLEETGGLEKYKIYQENIRVIEQSETQQLINVAKERTQVMANTPPGLAEADQGATPTPAAAGPLNVK